MASPPPVRTRKRAVLTAPADYEVGYKKTPRHTRFAPGRSGNTGGRPKGSVSIKTLLNRVMNETVVAMIDSRRKTITKREAVVRRLTEQSLNGQLQSMSLLFKLEAIFQAEAAPASAEAEATQSQSLTAAERRQLGEHLARLKDREGN